LTLDDSASGFKAKVCVLNTPTCTTWTRQMPAGRQWRFDSVLYRDYVWIDNYTERADVAQTTVYAGSHYEYDVVSGRKTSYYMFNGKQVAMRQYSGAPTNTSVTWMHGDHLGSASLLTNGYGATQSSMRYRPYGEVRDSSTAGAVLTNKRFTGQTSYMADIGLMDYGARFYNPLIGRFISPDTIVPGAGNSQAFNRYSYTLGNPLKYTDPSGHDPRRTEQDFADGGISVTEKWGRLIHTILQARFAAKNPGKVMYFDDSPEDRASLMSIFGGTPDVVVFDGKTYHFWSIKSERNAQEALSTVAGYSAGCASRGFSCAPGTYWMQPGEKSDDIGITIPGLKTGIHSELIAPGAVTYRLEAEGPAAAGAAVLIGKALKDLATGRGGQESRGPKRPPQPPPIPALIPYPQDRGREGENRTQWSLTVDLSPALLIR
jgi:RHS repeat-associated protein